MAPTSFPTATRSSRVKTRSTSILCAFPHASCGGRQRQRVTRSTLISGKTIWSPFEPMPDRATLPSLPSDEEGPVFAEPWQAHAFALAVKLSESGLFTWSEWSAALAEASRRGEPDDGSRYYHHWLAALERLTAAKHLVAQPSLLARKEEWAEAYRRTPHGAPVTLSESEETASAPHPLPLP